MTEYRQKRPNQKDNILIEVEILSRSEMEEVLTDYLWKYRLFYNADDNNELETEEHRICEADALQAWSALDTAFRHHQEFSKQFLQDDSSGAVERIKAKLVRWAEEIDWPDDVVNSVWRSSARDSRECFEMTRKFMGDEHWPFTKIIRSVSLPMCDIKRLTEPLQCLYQRADPKDWNSSCGLAWYVDHIDPTRMSPCEAYVEFRATRYQPCESEGYAGLLDEMQLCFHCCQHFPCHHRPVSQIFSVFSSVASCATGARRVRSKGTADCGDMHTSRGITRRKCEIDMNLTTVV